MFFNKNKELKLRLEKSMEEYKELEIQYLELRKKHLELQEKHEEFDILEDHYKDTIDKLAKELAFKTQLLAEYHLKFGEECAELFEKRVNRKNKKSNNEGVEL